MAAIQTLEFLEFGAAIVPLAQRHPLTSRAHPRFPGRLSTPALLPGLGWIQLCRPCLASRSSEIDAFTRESFGGNPAAVFLLPSARDESWMQRVAREMNQADTAFLVARDDEFDLRWFTPMIEVDLCGHATLASAHMLWESGVLPSGATARFRTRSRPSPPPSRRPDLARPAGRFAPTGARGARPRRGPRRRADRHLADAVRHSGRAAAMSAPSEPSTPTCRVSRRSRPEA